MYWNPAATAQFSGLNSELSYTLILPYANIDIKSSPAGSGSSGNIGIDATTSASYGAYQVSKDVWLGMAINSPFGLATKPDNTTYPGSFLGVTTKLLTVNANPTIAYRIAPGITIGAGVQMEWAQAKLQFRDPVARGCAIRRHRLGIRRHRGHYARAYERVRPSVSVTALNLPMISMALSIPMAAYRGSATSQPSERSTFRYRDA